MTINQSDRKVVMEILCYDFFFENYSAVNYFHLPCVISWVKQSAWLACQGTRVGRVHFIFSFLQIFQFATALKMAGPESVAKFSFEFSRERKRGGGGGVGRGAGKYKCKLHPYRLQRITLQWFLEGSNVKMQNLQDDSQLYTSMIISNVGPPYAKIIDKSLLCLVR